MYIIRHKKYKTFYGKRMSLELKDADFFKSYKQAEKIRSKRKKPDNWEIEKIKEEKCLYLNKY